MLREQKIEKMITQSNEMFSKHEFVERDDQNGRWVIARKRSDGSVCSDMLTEIIVLRGGRVFVGGDIDDCVFAYFGAKKENNPSKSIGIKYDFFIRFSC
jgi:hypothetical protein